jgi:hypothetical protein
MYQNFIKNEQPGTFGIKDASAENRSEIWIVQILTNQKSAITRK